MKNGVNIILVTFRGSKSKEDSEQKIKQNIICAKKVVMKTIELKICLGDILKYDTDLLIFPCDPNLHFNDPSIKKGYQHHFKSIKMKLGQNKIAIYSKFQDLNVGNVGYSIFCEMPNWFGVFTFTKLRPRRTLMG